MININLLYITHTIYKKLYKQSKNITDSDSNIFKNILRKHTVDFGIYRMTEFNNYYDTMYNILSFVCAAHYNELFFIISLVNDSEFIIQQESMNIATQKYEKYYYIIDDPYQILDIIEYYKNLNHV